MELTYLRGHWERCEGWVQVKGQRIAAVAVGRHQLLRRHRLELSEVAHWRIVIICWLEALGVEGPPVICSMMEVMDLSHDVCATSNNLVVSSHLHKSPPYS